MMAEKGKKKSKREKGGIAHMRALRRRDRKKKPDVANAESARQKQKGGREKEDPEVKLKEERRERGCWPRGKRELPGAESRFGCRGQTFLAHTPSSKQRSVGALPPAAAGEKEEWQKRREKRVATKHPLQNKLGMLFIEGGVVWSE